MENSSAYLEELLGVWKAFVTTEQFPDHHSLRPIIKDSWLRCRSLGVDHFHPGIEVLTNQELAKRLALNAPLIETAKPFMESLYRFVADSGFIVTLSDAAGYLLDLLGDDDVINNAKNIALTKGVNWAEQYMGTTAIGVCLATGESCQIWGGEHYCVGCQEWTCSAAPILDPDGKLIAVLEMSGNYNKAHPHTLGMVVAAADAITNKLSVYKSSLALEISNSFLVAVFESISDGLVSVNRSGQIMRINVTGTRLLGLPANVIPGTPLDAEISGKFEISRVLSTGYKYTDREVTLDLHQGRTQFTATVNLIRNDKEIIGAVITLREISRVRRLVHQMIGAKALFSFDEILGQSLRLRQAVEIGRTAAENDLNILLQGESGTGKELFAHAIHNASRRRNGPLVAINCAAIPRELVGSELFGYTEGAFTGAKRQGSPGKFELADGGTILLDEIGDMPWEIQATLLRVLEERQITRIGGTKVIPINVRVIAATNRNLDDEVTQGRFRPDLFYRLNVLSIRVPSLRERDGDVIFLAEHFLQRINIQMGTHAYFAPRTYRLLESYHWPGNIRELQNVVQQAILLSGGKEIGPNDLSFRGDVSRVRKESESLCLKEIERQSIQQALELCSGSVSRAAKMLGIGRTTLYRRVQKYHLTSDH